MASEKYRRLVDRLVDKTNRDELAWQESVAPPGLQVAFTNYTLTLSQEDTRDGINYVIAIVNAEGNPVDSFSDATLYDPMTGVSYHFTMADLYEKARRRAVGADRAIDDILDDLDDPA